MFARNTTGRESISSLGGSESAKREVTSQDIYRER